MKTLFGVVFIILLQGIICSYHFARTDEQLETALKMAGDNRAELENVLSYYRNDTLKLQAAAFLIRNMPGYILCVPWGYRLLKTAIFIRLPTCIPIVGMRCSIPPE